MKAITMNKDALKGLDELTTAMGEDVMEDGCERMEKTFEALLESLSKPAAMKDYTKEHLFRVTVAGLRLRAILNPDDRELALGVAAMHITHALLERWGGEQGEKAVAA